MDEVEFLLASRRVKKWNREWRELMLSLPSKEAMTILELVALLDASPTDELASDRRPVPDEREGR